VLTIQLPEHGYLKFNFFPQIEADNINVQLNMPQGTPIRTTEEMTLRLEVAAKALGEELENELGFPVFRSMLTSIGGQPIREKNSGATGSEGSVFQGAHLGEVNVELISAEQRDISSREVARRWEAKVGILPGVESLTYSSDLLGSDGDIDLRLAGSDLNELRNLADAIKQQMGQLPGVSGVRDDFSLGKHELSIEILPEGLAAGLSYKSLARQVRQGFYGEEVQRIQRGRDEVKMYVRYTRAERETIASIMNSRIRTPSGKEIPFPRVAKVTPGRGFSTINRANRSRTIDVLADIDTEKSTSNEIEGILKQEILPALLEPHPHVTASFEGPQKERKDFMSAMISNGIGALLAIFVLLAVPLRSYAKGLAIMAAIPFGLIGAFWGHIIMGFNLSMFSIIGIMALTGVVVNDSLVLIDYTSTLVKEGVPPIEAVSLGALRRFRAILLTTLTTFAGLTPLLLERSAQARFMIPMAVSLAFGVVFATLITLLLVPAFFLVIVDLENSMGRFRTRVLGR